MAEAGKAARGNMYNILVMHPADSSGLEQKQDLWNCADERDSLWET